MIDANSGMAYANLAGAMWDAEAVRVSEMVRPRGNTISTISEAEKARWIKACEPSPPPGSSRMKARNIDGAKLIETAKALLAKNAGAA